MLHSRTFACISLIFIAVFIIATCPASGAQLSLSWIDNSINESGFSIERAESVAGPFAEIAVIGFNETSYVNSGLPNGIMFYYRLRAFNPSGYSGYSNTAFATTPYGLAVLRTGVGSGTVTSVPSGIVCGAVCSAEFAGGTMITLTATPVTGSLFTGWLGGGCSGTGSCDITLATNIVVQANFDIQLFTLVVAKSGNGSGTVTSVPAGITCGAVCSANFASGTSVTLTASANAGSVFTGWSGGGCTGTASCVVSMTAATTVTANFDLITNPDAIPPTIPAGLSATAASGAVINLSWTASTDNVGIAAYHVERCQDAGCINFVEIASLTSTGYVNTGLATGITYSYRVRAADAAGNQSGYSNVAQATATAPVSNLMASYAFDEASGLTTVDSSGNGNTGTLINGPAWTIGRYNGALEFVATDNGNDDDDPRVVLSTSFVFPNLPVTVSAWINPTDYTDFRAIFSKRNSPNATDMRFDLGLSAGGGNVYVFTGIGGSFATFSYAPAVNVWTHLAVVATVTDTLLYADGVFVGTVGPITLGSNTLANTVIGGTGEPVGGDNDPFKGKIDDLRIYNRALTQAEIQTDMNTPVADLIMYALSVSKTEAGAGTVTSSPVGINCGAVCSANFASGTSVTLTASANAGSVFTGWSGGGCTGTASCVVAITGNVLVTAVFDVSMVSLAVNTSGPGIVTSNPAGINCGLACVASFLFGSSVTLTAGSDANAVFAGWGGDCSGVGPCTLILTAATSVSALFATESYSLTVAKFGNGSGIVSSMPVGITCGATCAYSFQAGMNVSLTAVPDLGSTFSGWTGACSGTGACMVLVASVVSVGATFAVTSFFDTFDRASSTNLGLNWLEAKGGFSITANELRNDAGALGNSIAIALPLNAANVSASARFASVDNNGGPVFGVIARYQDANNYYLCSRQTGGSSVLRISKIVNGVETVLKQKGIVNPSKNTFFALACKANGTMLTLTMGASILTVSDPSISQAGFTGTLIRTPSPFPVLRQSHRANDFAVTSP